LTKKLQSSRRFALCWPQPAKQDAKAKKSPAKAKGKKRRVLSPEARKRIADAQRKRWAAQKAKSK
jgi:hypothetical protein